MIEGQLYDKPKLKYGGAHAGRKAEPSSFLIPASTQDELFTKDFVSAYMAGLKGFLAEHEISLRHFSIVVGSDGDSTKTTLWGAFRSNPDFRKGYIEGLVMRDSQSNEKGSPDEQQTLALEEGYMFGKFVAELKKEKIEIASAHDKKSREFTSAKYEKYREKMAEVTAKDHIPTKDIMELIKEALGE